MKTMNVAVVLAIVLAAASAAPYSKFGRSCQDIGCRSDEKCIMAEEPCSYGHQRDQCGRYPTCQRINSGGESCTTKICSSGQYCRTENGRPTCVNTNAGLAFDSAGISSVNGHTLPNGQQQPAVPPDAYGTRYANGNPYANANAPPAEEVLGNRYNGQPPASSSNGYPPYPSNGNSNSGYPPYPVNSNSNGYHHQNVYPPPYTGSNSQNGGYPTYLNNPKLNPGWNSVHPNTNYRSRNGAKGNTASVLLVLAMSIVGCLRIIKA
ncbi:circumsporozoite protein-like isoform X2 [Phymastichus coffea]|uniref:circumsporozoite protein-like isoform X2 n=1 Tax=Phymastichus coffea TaxID=108790 RepID=UPI00273ABF13|nr:circumsporozoite protein-like isoform X2 [Phymastichus coffea]